MWSKTDSGGNDDTVVIQWLYGCYTIVCGRIKKHLNRHFNESHKKAKGILKQIFTYFAEQNISLLHVKQQ